MKFIAKFIKMFVIISILSIGIAVIVATGGGGGDDSNDTTGDNNIDNITLQKADVADTWRIYFMQNGRAMEDAEYYLYISLIDDDLVCTTLYEGVPASNIVSLEGKDIQFKYQEGERDWNITGSVDGDVMFGTWNDNLSDIFGTWTAEKALQLRTINLITYDSGPVVMELALEDGATVASFNGNIPQSGGDPVFTEYMIDAEGGEIAVVLNREEQITELVFWNMELLLSYNSDNSINYDLYYNEALIFSGSNINYSSSIDNLSFANIASEPQVYKLSTITETNEVNTAFYKDIRIIKKAVIYVAFGRFEEVYKEKYKNYDLKSGYYGYVLDNKEFNKIAEAYAVIKTLGRRHRDKLEKQCEDSFYKKECYAYLDKVMDLWSKHLQTIGNTLMHILIDLYIEYSNEYCQDSDSDEYYLNKGCGTKVDCNDNNASVNPGKREICNDGYDNDCNGQVDCTDSTCTNDSECTHDNKKWVLVKTSVLKSEYENKRENICLGEGKDGEIIKLAGNSITGHWYSMNKYCGIHMDVQGSINFDTPPSTADPGETVTLNTNGTQSGYQDCCSIILWFNYYTDAGAMTVTPEYVQLNLQTLDVTKVTYPDNNKTYDGWKGSVSDKATTTFTFPDAYVKDFWCSGRGNRGVGYAWHYQIQE